ncbi:CARDB domain-containing protein [Paenibacillus silviterrae]|uniref:CARDB domain-containing protein n=1 Tax=Paenibacillus silviterrae TaxID=3242194 RepID=UPI00254279F8|nr:CARDB domain-containing protein [Paenibacillus chinjuensis]
MKRTRLISGIMAVVMLLTMMIPSIGGREVAAETIQAVPQLMLKELGWSPTSPAVGSEVTFYADVENQGTAAYGDALGVSFAVDGATVSEAVYAGTLGPQQTIRLTGTRKWTAQPNEHNISVQLAGGNARLQRLMVMPAAELARGKPVAYSSQKSNRPASSITDGDIETQWESSAVPASVTVDLGAAYGVNKVVMSTGLSWSARTQTLSVEGSLDGSVFTTLATPKDYKFQASPGHRHEVSFTTANVRYVRIVGTKNTNAANGIQLTQLEVYEDPAYKPPGGGKPELAVSGLTWGPLNAFAGDAIVFIAELENRGDADFEGSPEVHFQIGGNTVTGTAAGSSIPRGWKTTVTSQPWTAPSDGTQTVSVQAATYGANVATYNVRIHDAALRLPPEWTYSQIGNHSLIGSALYNNGKFTLESAGADLTGSADEAVFVHRNQSGDIALEARLGVLSATDNGAGAGIMFREGLAANDDFISLRLLKNKTLRLDMRSNNGSVTSSELLTGVNAPKYLKLEKTGNAYSAYASEDGLDWGVPLTTKLLTLSGELKAGLVATAKNRSQLARAEIDHVRFSQIAKADLSVSEITLTPANPKPGETVAFSAEVRNTGLEATSSTSVDVEFKVDPSINSKVIATGTHTGIIQPGETVTITGTEVWSAQKGTHAIRAVVNPNGQAVESNLLNNERTLYAAVREPAANTAFNERARYLLETFSTTEPQQTDRTLWVKEAVFYAQARFELAVDVERALEWMQSINDNPAGASMFFYTANIDTYLKYGHLYSEALRAKVKQRLQEVDYSNNGSTENHLIKFRTAGYLTAQTWPDWSKAAVTKQFAERDIVDMLTRFVKYGMKEYDSTTYAALYLECLLMLNDYAEDPLLRQQARMTADWMLANIAGEWVNGYWMSSSLRDYDGVSPKLAAAGNVMAWLYLGGEERPRLRENELSYPEGMYAVMAALSEYRAPELVERIAQDRSEPHLHLESHDQHPTNKLNPPSGYRKTSYLTDRYGVASQFDGNGKLGWSDQLRRWLVRWVSPEAYSTFFMTHPKRGGIVSGGTAYEQVLQKDGAIIAVYNIPSGDAYPYVNGPFPEGLHAIKNDPSGWLFAHHGSVLLAVKPLKPYTWTSASIGTLTVPVIRSEALKNGVVVETAKPDSYAEPGDGSLPEAQRRSAELERFAEAIRTKTSVDVSALDNPTPALKYTSLAGDVLRLTYNGERSINGTAVDYDHWPLIRSPFMDQQVGSNLLTLRQGDEALVYNFATWQVSVPTQGPDVSPTRISWSPDQPVVGQSLTLSAEVTNVGLTPSPDGGIQVTFKADGTTIDTVTRTGTMAAGEAVTVVSRGWKPAKSGSVAVEVEVRPVDWVEAADGNNGIAAAMNVSGLERVLFTDDFASDITSRWDSAGSTGSWSHETDASIGSQVMKASNTATTGNPVRKVAKSSFWDDYNSSNRDYNFEFRAKYAGGQSNNGTGEQFRALVRFANPQSYYYFDFNDKNKTVAFLKYTEATGFVTINQPTKITDKIPGFSFGQYHRYRIQAEGDRFSLYINNQLVMQTAPDTSVSAGSVGFMNRNSELWIDEVAVKATAADPGPVDPTHFEIVLDRVNDDVQLEAVLTAKKASDLYAAQLHLAFDSNVMTLTRAEAMPEFGAHATAELTEQGTYTLVAVSRTAADGTHGVDGEVPMLRLVFTPKNNGSAYTVKVLKGSTYTDSKGDGTKTSEDREAVLLSANTDVNGDGTTDVGDLTLIGKAAGKNFPEPGYSKVYDMNGDGRIDAADWTYVARKLLRQ